MSFQDLLAEKCGFWGQNRGKGGAILTPNELVLSFEGSYICANFSENRSRNATVRVLADGHTHTHTDTLTDANRFYNLSHAICSKCHPSALTQDHSCPRHSWFTSSMRRWHAAADGTMQQSSVSSYHLCQASANSKRAFASCSRPRSQPDSGNSCLVSGGLGQWTAVSHGLEAIWFHKHDALACYIATLQGTDK